MSDIMRPMSFEQLLNWTLTEHKGYLDEQSHIYITAGIVRRVRHQDCRSYTSYNGCKHMLRRQGEDLPHRWIPIPFK